MSARVTLVVELCGRLADAAGRELAVAIPAAGCTVAALLAAVREAAPGLAPLLDAGKVRVCINEAIAPLSAPVAADDVVALFPPVSGG